MTGRTLAGARTPGALGLAGTVALMISACGSAGPEFARYCVDRTQGTVIDDRRCEDSDVGDNPHSPFGWYYQQMPDRTSGWDDDGGGYDNTPDFVMIPTGGRVYGGSYIRPPGVISGRTATSTGRVFTGAAPRAAAAGSGTGRVISRGGFGGGEAFGSGG